MRPVPWPQLVKGSIFDAAYPLIVVTTSTNGRYRLAALPATTVMSKRQIGGVSVVALTPMIVLAFFIVYG